MTNNTENTSILEYLIAGKFDDAFELARQDKTSSTDLIVLYQKAHANAKKKKSSFFGLFGIAEYWNSQLPFYHLDQILKSPLRVPFWTGYFSNDKFCSEELTEYLWYLSKDEFVKHFKLSWDFNRPNFIQSIQQLGAKDHAAALFNNEIKWVLMQWEQTLVEEDADNKEIVQFTFGDVLMGYALYHYAFKQDDQIAGDKEHQTRVEIALIEDIGRILKAFISSESGINVPFDSNEELQQVFESNRVPHKWLETNKEPRAIQKKYLVISQLITRAINRKVKTSELGLYLCGYADIVGSGTNSPSLVKNRSFQRFQRNDSKGLLEELYIFASAEISDLAVRNSITSSLKTFEFYGIPKELELDFGKISAQDLLQFLKDFSVFKGPGGRQFVINRETGENLHVSKRTVASEPFSTLFGSNESISMFDYIELIKKIGHYYQWEESKTKSLLSFFTLDLNEELSEQWIWRPFIKVGDKVVLLGSFMKDRRWENLMLNRFKREKVSKGIIRQLSGGFEDAIHRAFDEQGFMTKAGHWFKNSFGETGEIDTLAYKDDCLYVIEAKQGRRSNDFTYAAEVETNKLDGQATEQLLKIERYITMDWDALKEEWPALKGKELSKTRIICLIVTDGFEADRIEFTNGIRKVSFLELKVLLSNTKEKLFKFYLTMAYARSAQNPDFDVKAFKKMKELDWDLWDGQDEIRGNILNKKIDENAVWKEYENLWRF